MRIKSFFSREKSANFNAWLSQPCNWYDPVQSKSLWLFQTISHFLIFGRRASPNFLWEKGYPYKSYEVYFVSRSCILKNGIEIGDRQIFKWKQLFLYFQFAFSWTKNDLLRKDELRKYEMRLSTTHFWIKLAFIHIWHFYFINEI